MTAHQPTADDVRRAIERAHNLAPSPRPWRGLPNIDPTQYELIPELPGQLAAEFLAQFERLIGEY